MDDIALRQIIDRIPLLKYRYLGSVPSDRVPNLPNDTFANVNTEPSYMCGEHWVMIAKFKQQLYFADSLCNGCLIPSIDQTLRRPEFGARHCGSLPNTACFVD